MTTLTVRQMMRWLSHLGRCVGSSDRDIVVLFCGWVLEHVYSFTLHSVDYNAVVISSVIFFQLVFLCTFMLKPVGMPRPHISETANTQDDLIKRCTESQALENS